MATLAILGKLRNAVSSKVVRCSSLLSKRNRETYCIDPSIGLSEDQKRWQAIARDFAKDELFPKMVEWDKQERLPPRDVFKKAGDLGFGAIYCKKNYGGSDLSRTHASIIYEQLAAGCASTAAYMSVHNMCAWLIDKYGSSELRERYIPNLASFDTVASFFLTEPISGDDPTAIQLTAKLDGDHYILNGTKLFVLGYDETQLYVVTARHENKTGANGIFCIAVDKSAKGIEISKKDTKRYAWKDDLVPRTITFHDCRVPVANQIGGDVDGLTMSQWGINGSRVNVASCWLGAAQMSIDLTINHFKSDTQRGKLTTDVLSDEWELAAMASRLFASRLLVREAAAHIQNKTPYVTSFCAMAKLHAEDTGKKIMNEILEIYQRFGVIKASPMSEYLHDCRSHDSVVGSNAEMRVIVAQDLLSNKTFF